MYARVQTLRLSRPSGTVGLSCSRQLLSDVPTGPWTCITCSQAKPQLGLFSRKRFTLRGKPKPRPMAVVDYTVLSVWRWGKL